MNWFQKNLHQSEKILQTSLVLLLLLFGLVVGVAAGQKKAPPAPRPAAPPPAHHASAPVSHPAPNRPSTAPHSPNTGGRPGTSTGTRPGVGKTGTGTGAGTVGKTGTPGKTGTVNNSGRGPGKIGNGSTMGKPGMGKPGGNPGGNMGKGGNPSVSKSVNRPAPGRQVSLKGGGTANIRPNGQIRSINRNGMHIDHGLNGTRRIESTHNGARIVTTGKNSGYVQRAYVTRGGRTYVSRTVVVNHVTYTSVYRSYSYGGYCCYYGYHPAYYYGPAYYGWAYNPWPAPVYYGWGWGGAPWYGYYGGYFAPYPTYPSAAFWLTDYLISVNLQAAYAARAAANAAAANNTANDSGNGGEQPQDNSGGSAPADSGAVTLTPEVKAAIAEEVKAQLAAEQAAAKPASSGGAQPTQASEEVPPALDPARRTFVVSSDLTVTGDGQECQLTAGDVITRITDTPDDDRKVTVSVSSAKKADCAPGKQVAVAVDDLQEMHNHFQEQLDNGMKELSSKQGSGGLPKAPDTTPIASDVPPPPPDASAEKTLQDQQSAADQTEAQVVKEAFSQGS
jgi:hypothetical protein